MNGYTPMGACVGCPTPGYAGYGYPMAPYVSYDIIGQTAADGQPSFLDKLKAKGEEETFGIKNKYLAGGAAAIGIIALASSAGYFGMRRRGRK